MCQTSIGPPPSECSRFVIRISDLYRNGNRFEIFGEFYTGGDV